VKPRFSQVSEDRFLVSLKIARSIWTREDLAAESIYIGGVTCPQVAADSIETLRLVAIGTRRNGVDAEIRAAGHATRD
jgi:hypothetical protein